MIEGLSDEENEIGNIAVIEIQLRVADNPAEVHRIAGPDRAVACLKRFDVGPERAIVVIPAGFTEKVDDRDGKGVAPLAC